jgi:DNA-binding response OmpR family regulator
MELHFLIVDHDQVSADMLAGHLKKKNFKVTCVYSGKDCLEFLYDETPDMILLNMTMPELNGPETLERIRALHSMFDLPVMMMFTDYEEEQMAKCLEIGLNDYLEKPVNFEQALVRINIQMSTIKNFQKEMKIKGKESRSSVIATYNHEINNPLTIAYGLLRKAKRENNLEYLDRITETLQRVTNVVKDIEKFAEEEVELADIGIKFYKRA